MNDPNHVLKRIWRHMSKDRSLLLISFVCSAVLSATSFAAIWFIADSVGAMSDHDSMRLNMDCLGLIGSYTVRGACSYGQTVGFAEAGQRLGVRLRQEIYEHLQGLSLSYFNRQRTGALMSTMTNDVPILQNAVAGFKDITTAPFMVIGGVILIFKASVPMSLAVIAVVPVMVFAIGRINKQIKQLTVRTQDKLSDVTTMMEETLSGIRVIQSFSGEQREIDRFYRENVAAKNLWMRSTRRQAQLRPWIDVIGALGIAFAIWTAGHLIVAKQMQLDDLVKFMGFVNQIQVGLSNGGSAKTTLEQMKAAGERIYGHVLSIESDIQDKKDAHGLGNIEGKIEFRNVSFAYNSDVPVLQDVSFTMEPGQVVAVVGASGAGKSTLADLIPRFYDPNEGAIFVDGHDLKDVTLGSLRKHIGIVPQETVLFGGTIRDNIVYGDPSATDEKLQSAAAASNAHDFIINELPDGYDTIVGERGKQLSGGQRQRIAIARALLKNPRILILDEATSSLDTRSEELVQKALDDLMQGRTTLVIAHRLSTIMKADKILVMHCGRILESGTHRELLALGGAYTQLYETQYRGKEED